MLFSSITFLYYFLPTVILLYFLVPKKIKNSVLLLSSLFFYGWGEPRYLFLMMGTILAGYLFGILIEKFQGKALSKLFLTLSAILFLGALGYFKYADFFIANFNKVTNLSISFLKLALPIGISFYTFQILSYVIDVYRGDAPAQKNIINLGAYIALFPQLIAGPIVRYSDIEAQLNERKHSFDKAAYGIKRFIFGISKKVLLANSFGEIVEIFNSSNDKSVAFYWLFAISYTLQIYFDFSGYSDMAIGLGKIFGFDFLENFNYPYISKSITEFWRRWHMSLGTWFRDYVYIPLGGNRVSKYRHIINILAVWFLTGFWHGAEWNFIVWGLYFVLFLVVEKFFLLNSLTKSRVLSHVYVMLSVVISFVIFGSNNMGEAILNLKGMFFMGEVPLLSDSFIYYFKSYSVIILLGILFSTPVARCFENKRIVKAVEMPVMVLLLLLVTAFLADGSFNPFLYFRF